ncbi:guanine deaminase [Phormidium tenue]|uniref:Guanine deaminase n=1 Tax=Phormidium tenue NIES-30 TaxID=549789 RepID=A0A1U7J3K0_9CYAN|nr:guanine deaminase [Phormidium tenue]MBD2233413.1 guanine deaminase [Phormidium tenue FACHB-1052]OKH46866.1 guanine deaminase [Phormidium tenue NIES-30]
MGQTPATPATGGTVAIRGALLDCIADPFYVPEAQAMRYIPDGLLVVQDGHIAALGPYEEISPTLGDIPISNYTGKLITPGFIDTHIHYPQTGMMAAYGEQLLEWLNRYTFPIEGKFADAAYARTVAELFLEELLKNGTTTALVFAAVFPASVDAFFEVAEDRNLRMISGKVMMDRNAPDYLCDTAQSSYDESKALIEKWHGRGRLLYAVTPRFAGTSSEAQLKLAAQLLDEFPDVYLHTHLSENISEVAWIQEMFPQYSGYLDVYDQTGLVRARSLFAHGVQLTDAEFQRLSEAKAAISFCPTSNLFLGSGLFRIEQAKNPAYPVKVGLGTDVGAGTSFSMLQTTNEAYKVAQLRGQKLSAFKALFLATLGGARALCLEDKLGSFDPGKEADFVVLDPQATPLLALRNPTGIPTTLEELADVLFSLVIMGGDRAVTATYIMGELAYSSESPCTP